MEKCFYKAAAENVWICIFCFIDCLAPSNVIMQSCFSVWWWCDHWCFCTSRADCNTEGSSVDADTGLCGESQPDFRSILSYGVQEPWVKLSPSFFFFILKCCSLNSLPFCLLFFPNRRKFSDSIVEMLVVCATTVHRVGLQTAPNELCPRVPLMAWNTCAFTIQAIGTLSLGSLCLAVWFH